MQTPAPPDEHYLWLGRITAAYAMLDIQLGMIAHAADTGERWTEDWQTVAGRPGEAVRRCKAALARLRDPHRGRVERLLDEAHRLRLERHRLTHSVFVLDPSSPDRGTPWRLRDPRGGEASPLEAELGAEIVASLNRLSREARDIRLEIAALGNGPTSH